MRKALSIITIVLVLVLIGGLCVAFFADRSLQHNTVYSLDLTEKVQKSFEINDVDTGELALKDIKYVIYFVVLSDSEVLLLPDSNIGLSISAERMSYEYDKKTQYIKLYSGEDKDTFTTFKVDNRNCVADAATFEQYRNGAKVSAVV